MLSWNLAVAVTIPWGCSNFCPFLPSSSLFDPKLELDLSGVVVFTLGDAKGGYKGMVKGEVFANASWLILETGI